MSLCSEWMVSKSGISSRVMKSKKWTTIRSGLESGTGWTLMSHQSPSARLETNFLNCEINSWWFCQSMRGWRMINRYNNCDKWTIGSEFRLMSWGCWTLTSLEYAEQFVFGSVWRINLQYLANFKWLLCCLLCLCSLFFVLDSTCSPVIHLTWRRMKSPFNWILT